MIGPYAIHDELNDKGNKAADDIARRAVKDRSLLDQVFDGALSSNKRIKNAAAKTLRLVSEIDREIK